MDLPQEVAWVLNMMGVPWPDINEDDVRALATHVRNFAQDVATTHESATGTIRDMGSVYSGHSYSALLAGWGRMSQTHMADLDQACRMVARALDMAANAITLIKVVVVAEIVALVGTYMVVLATPGGGPLAPVLSAAARRICNQMEQSVVAYILAEVVGKAIEPFEQAIQDMINGLAYNTVSDVLDVPDSSSKQTLYIEPDEVLRYADVLDAHADDIMRHAVTFAEAVATLDFTTAGATDTGPASGGGISGPALRMPVDLPLLDAPRSVAMLADGSNSLRNPGDPHLDGILGARSTGLADGGSGLRPDQPLPETGGAARPALGEPAGPVAAPGHPDSVAEPQRDGSPIRAGQSGERVTEPDAASVARSTDVPSPVPSNGGPLLRSERLAAEFSPSGTTAMPVPTDIAGGQRFPAPDGTASNRLPGAAAESAAAPSPQQGAPQSSAPRGASGSGTPWARAASPPSVSGKPVKSVPLKPAPAVALPGVESSRTPWSKPPSAPEKVVRKVFAPTAGNGPGDADGSEHANVPPGRTADTESAAPPARPAVVAPDSHPR